MGPRWSTGALTAVYFKLHACRWAEAPLHRSQRGVARLQHASSGGQTLSELRARHPQRARSTSTTTTTVRFNLPPRCRAWTSSFSPIWSWQGSNAIFSDRAQVRWSAPPVVALPEMCMVSCERVELARGASWCLRRGRFDAVKLHGTGAPCSDCKSRNVLPVLIAGCQGKRTHSAATSTVTTSSLFHAGDACNASVTFWIR